MWITKLLTPWNVLILAVVLFGGKLFFYDDYRAAHHLDECIRKHPVMQNVCDLSHGCQNVKISCTRYDDYGNSDLRNYVDWSVEGTVPDAVLEPVDGKEYENPAVIYGGGKTLDDAILSWITSYRRKEVEGQLKIYPHAKSCTDCLE